MPDADLAAIKRRAAEALLPLPGVLLVGVGSKEVGGEPTGEASIKVFVHTKRPLADVPEAERIPATFEGVRTDVIETGGFVSAVDPPGALELDRSVDEAAHRPLVGGTQLSRGGGIGAGTLGCFVWDPDDPGTVFALTAYHVMLPPPPDTTTTAGQPSTAYGCCGCTNGTIGRYAVGDMAVIDTLLVGALNLELVHVPLRDEALIRLLPGMQWRAEVAEIGALAEAHEVTDAEVSHGTYKVRKRGQRTGLTGGVVSAAGVIDVRSVVDDLLLIRPNPAPGQGPNDVPYFVLEGDSGSVVVNQANEVVGLVHGTTASGLGVVLTIGNVLRRLSAQSQGAVRRIAVAPPGTVHTVPGSAMAVVPPEVAEVITGQSPGGDPGPVHRPVAAGWPGTVPFPTPATMHGVVADLDATSIGRLLVELWRRHQGELLDLVDTNKRVAMVWHRSGAAALAQYLVRMVQQPDLDLPETLNGRPPSEVIDRLCAVLARFASSALRADLERVRPLLPELGGRTYPQLVAALGPEQPAP